MNSVDRNEDRLQSLELRISKFLRAGVLTAGLLMLTGWLGLIAQRSAGDAFAAFHDYAPRPLGSHLLRLFAARAVAPLTAYAGLAVLISLPMIRVLLTAILFVRQRDWMLAGIAAFVLAALGLSFLLGLVE